uniref:Uncharacterized protein n=1 Tax=Chlamydomonas euryale TaxID=1486919 RepID=A0A7R9VTM9_9CHLO
MSAPSRRGSEGGDVEPPPQARLAHRPQAPGVHQAEPQQQQHEQQHGQQHEPQQDLPCGAAQTEQPGGDCDHPGPCEAAYTEQAGGDGDQPDNGAGPGVLRASSPLSRSCSAALTPMPGCAPVPLAVAELADSVRVAAGVSAALPRSHSMRCRAVRHDEGSSRAGGH